MDIQNVAIEAIAYVPADYVVRTSIIEEQIRPLTDKLGLNPGWFEELTGVKERRMWNSGQSVADIASYSVKRLLEISNVPKESIGCIVNCSVSLDRGEPTVGIEVHEKLGFPSTCRAHGDIADACMGFTTALEVVSNMIKLGQIDYGIVFAGEDGTRLLENTVRELNQHNADFDLLQRRFAALTIGSGSVAMLLCSERKSRNNHILLGSRTLTDSRFWKHCIGALDRTWLDVDAANMMKDGIDILQWMEEDTKINLPMFNDDIIDVYIPHQISKRHNDVLCEVTSISEDKLYVTYPFLGNLGPAAWPVAMYMANDEGAIKDGDYVGICSMGSGFNCSCTLVQW